MKEIWKDIEGYEGMYEVSTFGRIKSHNIWNGHKYIKGERILKPTLRNHSNSYYFYTICLTKNKTRKHFRIHRLVAQAFIPNNFNKPHINHIDSNPLNNNVSNLEWCTPRENVIHSYTYGNKKRTYDINKVIKLYKSGLSSTEVAKEVGITKVQVYGVLKRNNIPRRTISEIRNKYHIPLDKLLNDFNNGCKNKDLAVKYNTNRVLIAQYKYKFKKEGLI